jgi:hypothetical protein
MATATITDISRAGRPRKNFMQTAAKGNLRKMEMRSQMREPGYFALLALAASVSKRPDQVLTENYECAIVYEFERRFGAASMTRLWQRVSERMRVGATAGEAVREFLQERKMV